MCGTSGRFLFYCQVALGRYGLLPLLSVHACAVDLAKFNQATASQKEQSTHKPQTHTHLQQPPVREKDLPPHHSSPQAPPMPEPLLLRNSSSQRSAPQRRPVGLAAPALDWGCAGARDRKHKLPQGVLHCCCALDVRGLLLLVVVVVAVVVATVGWDVEMQQEQQ